MKIFIWIIKNNYLSLQHESSDNDSDILKKYYN